MRQVKQSTVMKLQKLHVCDSMTNHLAPLFRLESISTTTTPDELNLYPHIIRMII